MEFHPHTPGINSPRANLKRYNNASAASGFKSSTQSLLTQSSDPAAMRLLEADKPICESCYKNITRFLASKER